MLRRVSLRIRAFYSHYSTVLVLALVYGSTKLLASLFLQQTFAAYGPGVTDFLEQGRFTVGGAYPLLDYWTEYPPMFPWMMVAAYRLSTLLPGDQLIWFGTLERWFSIPFDVGALILVFLTARRLGSSEEGALRASFFYAVAFATIYVPLGWFDVQPTFWLLLSVYLALANRPIWTGVASGVGFLSKPIPLLALPMAWQRFRPMRMRLKLVLAALASALIPTLPFIVYNPVMVIAFLRNMLSRSSFETVWALLEGYHGVGKVAPLSLRFDPSSASWVAHSGGGAYHLWVSIGFGILFVFLWSRHIDWQDNRRATSFVALTWSLFGLWSKGYSPQWSITFVPFVALLMPNLRGALYLFLLGVAIITEWPTSFVLVGSQQWFLDAVVIGRTVLICALALEFGTISLADPGRARQLRRVYTVLVGVLVAVMVVVGVRAAYMYVDQQLASEPLRPAISTLQSEITPDSGLVCSEIGVCEQIRPYVPHLQMHWLPDPESWQANEFSGFASSHPDVWLVEAVNPEKEYGLSVERWLSERCGKQSQSWVVPARIARFVCLDLPELVPADVRFGDRIDLLGYAYRLDGSYLNLLLVWEAAGAIDAQYKPFIHLIDSDGQIVAQNDQYPVGDFSPPSAWQPGTPVRDLHGLILPQGLVGPYRLRIGWYDPDTGERLEITGPAQMQGQPFLELPIQ